jgi:hypothetical protein
MMTDIGFCSVFSSRFFVGFSSISYDFNAVIIHPVPFLGYGQHT